MPTTAKTFSFYLHTHWDREWYFTFEQYRMQLPGVIGNIIKQIESGALPSFQLDGQAVVLEDVLEIQPQLRNKIESLVKSGKLFIGPWYVLCDHMLVSGESLIRNMKTGLSVARQFGKPMMVGYSPDTFGHTQDMPRLLRGFSIDKAVVWRGVPGSLVDDGTEFIWESPDGSTVFCHLLTRGYYHTFFHEAKDPNKPYGSSIANWAASKINNSALVPVGGDHIGAPPSFNHQLQMLKDSMKDNGHTPSLEVVSLSDYLGKLERAQESSKKQIPIWEGELRDNQSTDKIFAGYLLPGVLSSRLYLKKENRGAEHRLFKIVEPVSTFASGLNLLKYPFEELLYTLKQVLRNQPHDSICGCSIDPVHQEMMSRYQGINSILDNLELRVRESLLTSSQASKTSASQGFSRSRLLLADPLASVKDFLLFNFSSRPVSGPVPFEMAFDNQKLTDAEVQKEIAAALDNKNFQIDVIEKCTDLFGWSGGVPTYRDVTRTRGYLYADKIPPLGCANYSASNMPENAAVKAKENSLSNQFLNLKVDAKGNVSVEAGKKKYDLGLTFKDQGDGGDSYNFDPLYEDEPVKATFKECRTSLEGPLVSSITLHHEIEIPETVEERPDRSMLDAHENKNSLNFFKRSKTKIKHQLYTEISVKAGVPILFFKTTWENKSLDHRLEVVFNAKAKETYSENHFSLVRRDVTKSSPKLPVKRAQEAPLDRFPCQRFFIAGDQLFLNSGLPEYSANEDSVSITLLRSFSMLSRPGLWARGGGAGPYIETPEGNCLGEQTATYGWAPLSTNDTSEAYHLATLFEGPLWAAPVCQKGWKPKLPPSQQTSWSFCNTDNPQLVLMSLFEDAHGYNLRFLNTSDKPLTATLTIGIAHRYLEEVDLDGYRLTLMNTSKPGAYEVDFRANELKSLRLNLKSQG